MNIYLQLPAVEKFQQLSAVYDKCRSYHRPEKIFFSCQRAYLMDLKEKVRELIEEVIEDMGYKLFDIQFGSENGRFALIIKIDKEGGVNIEDCAKVSRVIDPILEEADLVKKSWVLIVSSPGIK